jgi:hypothetical protein
MYQPSLLLHVQANEFNVDEKPRPYWWHFAQQRRKRPLGLHMGQQHLEHQASGVRLWLRT